MGRGKQGSQFEVATHELFHIVSYLRKGLRAHILTDASGFEKEMKTAIALSTNGLDVFGSVRNKVAWAGEPGTPPPPPPPAAAGYGITTLAPSLSPVLAVLLYSFSW